MAVSLFLDRRLPEHVLDMFAAGGEFRPLVDLALADRSILDLQLRRKAWSTPERGESWASLYAGLSSVVTVNVNSRGAKLSTHATYRRLEPFQSRWLNRQPVEELASEIEKIIVFAQCAIDHVVSSGQFLNEGRVHAALAATSGSSPFRLPNREVSVAFKSTTEREKWMAPVLSRLQERLDAVEQPPGWWPTIKNLGTGCDFLGVDDDGRLLALEAKPANATSGIAKGPLQVSLYAELLRAWTYDEPDHRSIIEGMLVQRERLGLTAAGFEVGVEAPVVPVLAIGDGATSAEGLRRARTLSRALAPARAEGVLPLELWRLDASGERTDVEIIE